MSRDDCVSRTNFYGKLKAVERRHETKSLSLLRSDSAQSHRLRLLLLPDINRLVGWDRGFFQPLIGERSFSIAIDVVFVDHLTKLNALLNKMPNVTKNRYVRRWSCLSGAPFLYSPKRLLTSSPTKMTRSSSSSRSRRKPDFLTLRKEAPGR